jgi:hypothetical protein
MDLLMLNNLRVSVLQFKDFLDQELSENLSIVLLEDIAWTEDKGF